jgi:PAS domain S-box-containing protein
LRPRKSPVVEVLITAVRSDSCIEEAEAEILWQIRDITELKRKEATERQQFFRTTFEESAVGMAHVGPAGEWLRVNWKLCQILDYSADELKQQTYRDVTYVEDLATSDEIHRQLMSGETLNCAFEKRHLRKDGSVVWTRVTASAIRTEAGEFLYNIVVIEDISERKQIEAAEREQRLLAEALHDTAIAVTSSLHFSEVIDHILTALERVVPHEAAVLMLEENGTAYVVRTKGYAENGLPELKEALLRFRVPIQHSSVLQQMQQTKKPLLLSHRNDQRYWDSLPDMPAIRSCVGAPILARDEVIGFLKLHSQKPGFFTEQHARLLEAFAAQAAVAIQNARAYEQGQTVAVMRDRQRLARDLHDDVSQALFSANVLAESLPRLCNNIPAKVSEQLIQLQMLTRGALAEMRTLLLELRPEHLSNIDLQTQLQQLVDALKARKRIEVDLKMKDATSLPSEVRVAFYRIAQEVLNNVAKHARAERVAIALDADSDYAHLVIRDNGTGFALQNETAGLGLHIMRERAEGICAQLKIASQPNAGTMVSVFWQLIPEGIQ